MVPHHKELPNGVAPLLDFYFISKRYPCSNPLDPHKRSTINSTTSKTTNNNENTYKNQTRDAAQVSRTTGEMWAAAKKSKQQTQTTNTIECTLWRRELGLGDVAADVQDYDDKNKSNNSHNKYVMYIVRVIGGIARVINKSYVCTLWVFTECHV